MKPRTTCPDCDERLEPIKIIDATERAMGGGASHVEMSYAAPKATGSQFTQTIPRSGTVKAKMCVACGRIILYGDGTTGGLRRTE
jgi:hypothetical protein